MKSVKFWTFVIKRHFEIKRHFVGKLKIGPSLNWNDYSICSVRIRSQFEYNKCWPELKRRSTNDTAKRLSRSSMVNNVVMLAWGPNETANVWIASKSTRRFRHGTAESIPLGRVTILVIMLFYIGFLSLPNVSSRDCYEIPSIRHRYVDDILLRSDI